MASPARTPFPFTAIVGQAEMKQALLLAAVEPRLGGVMVFGDRSIAQIHCPVLLLHGERDKTVPPSTSHTVAQRLAARGTRAEHHGLPSFGHLAHEEAPERHAHAVAQFARDVGLL